MTYPVLLGDQLLAAGAAAGPVLGLDTGTSVAKLGLVANGKIVAGLSRPATSHGAALPAAVEDLLMTARLGLKDLKGIAIGIGPGSFTGLRVGLSYAKGLALAAGISLVGVPSLDAMALSAINLPEVRVGTQICPLIDARKGEVYTALYRFGTDALEKLTDDLIVKLQQFAPRITGEVVFVGDTIAERARELVGGSVKVSVAGESVVDVAGGLVAAIGAARLARGNADRPGSLEPLYVRPSEVTAPPVVDPGEVKDGTARGTAHPAVRRQ